MDLSSNACVVLEWMWSHPRFFLESVVSSYYTVVVTQRNVGWNSMISGTSIIIVGYRGTMDICYGSWMDVWMDMYVTGASKK